MALLMLLLLLLLRQQTVLHFVVRVFFHNHSNEIKSVFNHQKSISATPKPRKTQRANAPGVQHWAQGAIQFQQQNYA